MRHKKFVDLVGVKLGVAVTLGVGVGVKLGVAVKLGVGVGVGLTHGPHDALFTKYPPKPHSPLGRVKSNELGSSSYLLIKNEPDSFKL